MRTLLLIILFLCCFPSLLSCTQEVGDRPQTVEDEFSHEGEGVRVEVWVENLRIPWSLVFLSKSKALVSERPGMIKLIRDGSVQEEPYAEIDVEHVGEGGLMGLAIHPHFSRIPFIYAMHTYEKGNKVYNRVIRLKDQGDKGVVDRIVMDEIPGGRFHNGGRIAFGPDEMLYITTGETFDSKLAQDIHSLGGKILRITPGGKVPQDNPFRNSPVYSYGHRNPQGITWNPETGDMFASEHGPSGEFTHFGHDEINIIKKGGNYGWPDVIGAPGRTSYIDPIIVWKKATPPSGLNFYKGDMLKHLKGDLFVATLRSQTLVRIKLAEESGKYKVTRIQRWFSDDYSRGIYGRIRDVVEGPDGFLYFITNNRDGRGSPKPGDDRIYRIVPKKNSSQ